MHFSNVGLAVGKEKTASKYDITLDAGCPGRIVGERLGKRVDTLEKRVDYKKYAILSYAIATVLMLYAHMSLDNKHMTNIVK